MSLNALTGVRSMLLIITQLMGGVKPHLTPTRKNNIDELLSANLSAGRLIYGWDVVMLQKSVQSFPIRLYDNPTATFSQVEVL